MERELENKIFMLNEFINKDDMEENIKKYIDSPLAKESVQILYNRLKEIKNNAN